MNTLILNECGQGLSEYALILGLAALAGLVGVSLFGGEVNGLYDYVLKDMPFGKE